MPTDKDFDLWWSKYYGNYLEDRPFWRVRSIARQAFREGSYREFVEQSKKRIKRLDDDT